MLMMGCSILFVSRTRPIFGALFIFTYKPNIYEQEENALTMRFWAHFIHSNNLLRWVRVPSLAPENRFVKRFFCI